MNNKLSPINSNASVFCDYDFSLAPNTNPIFNLLKECFFEQQVKAGTGGCFLPLPFPTGVGKTYNTLGLILEAMLDDVASQLNHPKYSPRLCFYITNSVDNVYEAYTDLRKRIEQDERFTPDQKDALLTRVLYAPANDTSLTELLTDKPDTLKQILKLFNVDQNSSLTNELRSIERQLFLKQRLPKDPEILKEFETQLREKASDCYSQLVRHIQRIQLGNDPIPYKEENIRLLSELIPGVLLESGLTRVVFMTTQKFLFGLQQSQGKYHPIRDLSGNLLVIDELDRQHQEILAHLVRTDDTDLLSTIRTIHANLRTQQLCKKTQYQGIDDLFTEYLEEVKDFVEHWKLQFSFDLHPGVFDDEKEILLFSDKLTTHNTSISKQLCIGLDSTIQQHIIATYGSLDIQTVHNFPRFLGQLEKLVNRRFHSLMRRAEEKYRSNLNAHNPHADERRVTSSQAVASILDQLNLHSLRQQLSQQLNYLVGHQYSDRRSAANYHTRGIRMIEVDRLPEAQDSVMFRHHGFHVTPTGMLATWVESGCYVLGVSATAESKSVIHNFDICYLKESLQKQYVELTPAQRQTIHDYYSYERNYHAVGVKIAPASVAANITYLKNQLCTWKPKAKSVDLLLVALLELDGRNHERNLAFHYGWLSKLCIAIKDFTEQENNRYMIAMLNRGIKPKLAEFLCWFAGELEHSSTVPVKLVPKVNADFLKTGQFEAEVIKYLEQKPGKVIAITTYQTMSIGKNPDYHFDPQFENDSLRQVGHRSSHKTDIDCLYLENPTNLISISEAQESKTSDRLLLLSYGMALQEVGTLTLYQGRNWCKDVVQQASPSNTCIQLKFKYYTQSVDRVCAVHRIIEQAVGRTARTEMKRNHIVLLADEDLLESLAQDVRDDALFSHEYKALVKLAQSQTNGASIPKNWEERRQQNLAVLRTARSMSAIDNMLGAIEEHPGPKTIDSWKQLRKTVLMTPVSKTPPVYYEYYLQSPTAGSYNYIKPEQEREITEYRFFDSAGTYTDRVSERECRLSVLLNNEAVSAHFNAHGYALNWDADAHYILTPPMFTNIYKGALGEEAGEAVLSHYGFSFKALPIEHFERFDGLIELSGGQALIDFKHWDLMRWRSVADEIKKEVMAKFTSKTRAIGLSRLVVCNLLGDVDDPVLYFDDAFKVCNNPKNASIIALPAILCEKSGDTNISAILALSSWLAPTSIL
ncbi:MAG: hypothetical protein K9L79_15955 [Methylobacter tundripaludum]|nr:hypothetical protein [Methylobacter tundripaludum]